MGLLQQGQDWLNDTLKTSEGVDVSYSRSGVSVPIRVRLGRTLFSGLQEKEITVQWGERDYLIKVADLIIGGNLTTPMRGDRITHAGDEWELSSPETGEAPWRYSDNTRTVYRVHVKRVS